MSLIVQLAHERKRWRESVDGAIRAIEQTRDRLNSASIALQRQKDAPEELVINTRSDIGCAEDNIAYATGGLNTTTELIKRLRELLREEGQGA